MNRWMIVIAPLIPFLVNAQEEARPPSTEQRHDGSNQNQQNQRQLTVEGLCTFEGTAYQIAAQFRDGGQSPQEAYRQLSFIRQAGVPAQDVKDAINNVYFDDRFANAGGQVLANQTAQICMNAHNPNFRPFEPLK